MDYYFDEKSADRAVQFIEKYITHCKGELAGQPFILEDWQKEKIIEPLFGWKREDGTRKFRTCYIEIPRKNGKSTLCAGLALYMLYADGELGAEVISAAADRQQAGIVFDIAKNQVLNNKELSKRGKVFRNSITLEKKIVITKLFPQMQILNMDSIVVQLFLMNSMHNRTENYLMS